MEPINNKQLIFIDYIDYIDCFLMIDFIHWTHWEIRDESKRDFKGHALNR